jgi:O-antigen/teichoic acid export membrane protein
VYVLVYGKEFVSLISKGKYADSHFLLASILVVLVPSTHQWVLSIVASTIERNELQLKSALIAVVMLPVAMIAIPEMGLYGAVFSIYLGSIFYNVYATKYLRKMGYPYRQGLEWAGACIGL